MYGELPSFLSLTFQEPLKVVKSSLQGNCQLPNFCPFFHEFEYLNKRVKRQMERNHIEKIWYLPMYELVLSASF